MYSYGVRPWSVLSRFATFIGHQEGRQLCFQVVMSFVVILFHGGLLARTVHPFDWAIGPGMVGLGATDGQDHAHDTRDQRDDERRTYRGVRVRELDAVIGQYRVDLVGYLRLSSSGGTERRRVCWHRHAARHRQTYRRGQSRHTGKAGLLPCALQQYRCGSNRSDTRVNCFFWGLSPSMAGKRLMPCRC